jgi:hypothetical protein
MNACEHSEPEGEYDAQTGLQYLPQKCGTGQASDQPHGLLCHLGMHTSTSQHTTRQAAYSSPSTPTVWQPFSLK